MFNRPKVARTHAAMLKALLFHPQAGKRESQRVAWRVEEGKSASLAREMILAPAYLDASVKC